MCNLGFLYEKNGKLYRKVVLDILRANNPKCVIDIACGGGWLGKELSCNSELDGVDAFGEHPMGYRNFFKHDINSGLPKDLSLYDAAVICEAMAYIQNPGGLIGSVRNHLKHGGTIIITDPNPLYVGARINYLIQGFPRSHSYFIDNDIMKPHMPWMNLGLFQYWLLLGLNGFKNIKLHDVDEEKPKHLWEFVFGSLVKAYYANRFNKAGNSNERMLWKHAASNQHVYGRRLVISAEAG
jgi:SAM-dependent methyltransferase